MDVLVNRLRSSGGCKSRRSIEQIGYDDECGDCGC